jgi:type IV secretory pathway TraG/TraD family ATPase VirD4
MIDRHAAAQRSGVLGSLNMVADAFKLLPRRSDTDRRWSTVEWAKERKGWIFLTSKPTMREQQRPVISLWLDLLVLRMMDDGGHNKRKTWFVLDELASLQRLPQLTTAITETRKSNNPMVLGFQGKAQIEALYGHVTEALLSQPATKIFLRTSEPKAAAWIAEAIGEVEIERFRESRTHGRFPSNSGSDQRDITREPLVMASEIAGLQPLHGYLKHENLVLPMRFPYLQFQSKVEKFMERKPKATPVAAVAAVSDVVEPADHDVFEKELRIVGERKPPMSVCVSKERRIEANGTSIHFD